MAGRTRGAERDARRILAEAGVAAIDDLRGQVAALEARLAEVERERDAAVASLRELEARAEQAERELDRVRVDLVTAQHAIGEGWFAGGADTATAIERKTKALEDGARDAGARAAAAEERLAALTQAAGEAAETLDALIYWHDCGDIDRSWWEDARDRVAALRAAMADQPRRQEGGA